MENGLAKIRADNPVDILSLVTENGRFREHIKSSIESLLDKYNQNQRLAAKALGIPRTTFRDYMRKYDVCIQYK